MYTGPKRVPAIAVTAYHDRREELITEGFPALVERLRDPLTLCKVIRHTLNQSRALVGDASRLSRRAGLDHARVRGAPHPTLGSIRRETARRCHRRVRHQSR